MEFKVGSLYSVVEKQTYGGNTYQGGKIKIVLVDSHNIYFEELEPLTVDGIRDYEWTHRSCDGTIRVPKGAPVAFWFEEVAEDIFQVTDAMSYDSLFSQEV